MFGLTEFERVYFFSLSAPLLFSLMFELTGQGVGGCLYALIIAYLTTVAMTQDANRRLIGERLDSVNSYVKNRRCVWMCK